MDKYDTLEYSWVKATTVFVHLRIYLCAFKNTNISPQVHHVWATYAMEVKWLGYVARLTHVMKELIAFETWHGVMWPRWRRSRQGLARRTSCKCEGQVKWWLGADGPRQWWRASEVKIDEPIWSYDDMKWIISFDDWLMHVLHRHQRRWNGMRKAKV